MRRTASTPPHLPGYEHVRLLGSGGFSDVFLYDQELPRRRVAVKVLLVDELTPANRAAFTAEANLMAQLSAHPFIVTIHQAGVSADDRPYLVMEYCSGPSLADRYKERPLGVEDALRTGVRLAGAVATAHEAGILHRDIKPGNVLSNAYGWPALTDFGISSAVEDEVVPATATTAAGMGTESTGTGQVGMSVPWSPPEMFSDAPQPDVRSDVFSLAATLWTVLAGRTPFEIPGRSNGALDLIGRIERGAIHPMDRTDVPPSLLAVLRKGMAARPADRFATAIDLGRALQRTELELGYAPTALDVPSLHVESPERVAGPAEDETRARVIPTVEAQAPPVAPAAPIAEPTVVRMPVSVDAQPVAEHTIVRDRAPATPPAAVPVEPPPAVPPELSPDAQATARRRRVPAIVIGVVAVVLAAVVVIGIVLFGDQVSPEAVAPSPSGPGIVLQSVPTPEPAGDVVLQGSTVTLRVTNPDPQPGDTFLWRISNRAASEGLRPADGDLVEVEGFDGTTLCIEVFVLRSGKTSPAPLEICYP